MVLTAVSAFAEVSGTFTGMSGTKDGTSVNGYDVGVNTGSDGPSATGGNNVVINVTNINIDNSIDNSYNKTGTDTLIDKEYTYTLTEKTVEKTVEKTTEKETAGDITDSYNTYDNSIKDSYNDNSVTETTTTTEGGNASASASASASAAAGDAGSGKKSSGSGSSSSSADTSKGASSSASSSAKAVAVSKSSGSGSSSSSTVVAPSIELVVVPDTAETTALKNAFAEAIKAGDPKTALPENISSKLSADLKSVNEFVTAKLVGDITGIASATVNIQFPTKYAAGDKVVVLFGIPNGNTTQWINVNGIIESDGSISMILTSTVLQALSGKTFALAVLSK
jgi:hypothetical protein